MRYLLRTLLLALLIATAVSVLAQDIIGAGPPMKDTPEHIAHVAAVTARMHQADALLSQARGNIKKGELAKAVPLLQQTLTLFPMEQARALLADIYIQWNQPTNVLNALQPIVYTDSHTISGVGKDPTTRMKYVLALLDVGKWEEAATLYEQSMPKPLPWYLPIYGVGNGDKEHTVPDVHFDPNIPDAPGLRAQAHLILGTRQPLFNVDADLRKDTLPYLLAHIQQALKNERNSLDANFLSGVLLGGMERFAEARAAFARTAKLAPKEAQPEIKATLDKMNRQEEFKKLYEAQEAARKQQQAQSTAPPKG